MIINQGILSCPTGIKIQESYGSIDGFPGFPRILIHGFFEQVKQTSPVSALGGVEVNF